MRRGSSRRFVSAFAPSLAALLLVTGAAHADRVALLAARGSADEPVRAGVEGDLARAVAGLRHTAVPQGDVAAALKGVADGVADSPEEYRSVGMATKADWVLVGSVDLAGSVERVELTACLVSTGRVESVARDVDRAQQLPELQEMLGVLLRPEGVGAGALPWERPAGAKPPPPSAQTAPPKPPAPWDGTVHLAYPSGEAAVWPPYSGAQRGFAAVLLGGSVAVARPEGAAGSAAAFTGAARVGYAPTDLGLEVFGELGGNLFGPRALWIEAGGRWMLTPLVRTGADGQRRGFPLHLGPEIVAGAFVRLPSGSVSGPGGVTYASSTAVNAVLGGALDVAVSVTPRFQLEANLGNLRWIPSSDGSIVVVGMTVGGAIRF